MNVGGLFVLFIVAAAGVLGLVLIFGHANGNSPVDTYGSTTTAQDNSTREALAAQGPSIIPIAGGIVLIVAVLILGAILIFFASARSLNYNSRY